MQLMHNTLIFYVQVPVACISSLIVTFLKTFCMSGFLHNRVATMVTIVEQISPKSDFFKRLFTDPDYQVRNHRGCEASPRKFFVPLGKMCWT